MRNERIRKLLLTGGVVAGIVLIAFGIGSIGVGFNGRDEVRDRLANEKIVGTPDSSIADQPVDTGAKARTFAGVMRGHALDDTGGQVYAEMGRFLDENGEATSDEKLAAEDPKTGEPVSNPGRNIWVTETSLATALNVAFLAEGVSTFVIVMGIAMVLAGIGFLVLTLTTLRGRSEPS